MVFLGGSASDGVSDEISRMGGMRISNGDVIYSFLVHDVPSYRSPNTLIESLGALYSGFAVHSCIIEEDNRRCSCLDRKAAKFKHLERPFHCDDEKSRYRGRNVSVFGKRLNRYGLKTIPRLHSESKFLSSSQISKLWSWYSYITRCCCF